MKAAGLQALKREITKTATNKWGEGKVPKALKFCLTDGNDKDYDGYAGMWALSSANSVRPTVVDRNKAPLVEADGVIYAGCYVNAIVSFWAQDNQYGKRVNCNLGGIQFLRDGDSFGVGGTRVSEDAFDDLEESGDDDFNQDDDDDLFS
jgi:hypothetical protein